MPLDTNLFSVLRLPQRVPDGALNSTGVQSGSNELLLRSRRTEPLASQVAAQRNDADTVQFELERICTYLPPPARARLVRWNLLTYPPYRVQHRLR